MMKDDQFAPEMVEQQIDELKELVQENRDQSNSPDYRLIQNLQQLYKGFEIEAWRVDHAYQRLLQQTDRSIEPNEQKVASLKTATSKPRAGIIGSGLRVRPLWRPRLIAAVFLLGVLAVSSLVFALSHRQTSLLAQRTATPTATQFPAQGTSSITPSTGISHGLAIGTEPQPILYNNTLYLNNGSDIRAYSAQNGAYERTYSIDGGANNPTIVDGILYASNHTSTFALRLGDGKVLWQAPFGFASPPLIVNGVLFISAAPDDPTRTYNAIYALQTSDGKLLWQYRSDRNNGLGHPFVMQGVVYFNLSYYDSHSQTYNNFLDALNATNGSLLWQKSLGHFEGSDLISDGSSLYEIVGESVEALDTNGNMLWSTRLAVTTQSNTSVGYFRNISKGIIYVAGGNNTIYAVRTADGSLLWNYQVNTGVMFGSFIVDVNTLYVGIFQFSPANVNLNRTSSLLALNINNGHVIWQNHLANEGEIPNPTIANGIIYVTYNNGGLGHDELSALRETDGLPIWTSTYSLN